LSETKEKKAESSPEKETKNARKKRERKELAKKLSADKRKDESFSESDKIPVAKEPESDASSTSKHDAFIKSISLSF
jgi:hypothetical protein